MWQLDRQQKVLQEWISLLILRRKPHRHGASSGVGDSACHAYYTTTFTYSGDIILMLALASCRSQAILHMSQESLEDLASNSGQERSLIQFCVRWGDVRVCRHCQKLLLSPFIYCRCLFIGGSAAEAQNQASVMDECCAAVVKVLFNHLEQLSHHSRIRQVTLRKATTLLARGARCARRGTTKNSRILIGGHAAEA